MTERTPGLGLGFGASFALHAALIGAILVARGAPQLAPPRVFRIQLTAAPQAAEPAIGVVTTKPPPTAVKPAKPLPQSIARPDRKVPIPTAKPTVAPPPPPPKQVTTTEPPAVVPKTAAPQPAAGSAAGGSGADLLNLKTPGVDFPDPAYIRGIANAIEAGFPPQAGTLTATVKFTIYRDGSVHDLALVSRSGAYKFDVAAEAAVDHAGNTKAFGPLPAVFHDDALTVYFTFSPPKPPNL